MITQHTLTTADEIYNYLLSLQPNEEVYRPVKRFMADRLYKERLEEVKKLYTDRGLEDSFKLSKTTVKREWDNFIKNKEKNEDKQFQAERALLRLTEKIMEANSTFMNGEVSDSLNLISEIENEVKEWGAEEYLEEYIQPLKNRIENHQYVVIENDKPSFHEGLILYYIELRIYSLIGDGNTEMRKNIAKRIYEDLSLGERIKRVINATSKKISSDRMKKSMKEKLLKQINEGITGSIDSIDKEEIEFFNLVVFFESLYKGRGEKPFTDKQIEEHALKQNFERLKELYERFKDKMDDEHRERYDRILNAISEKLKRPYEFISFVEQAGEVYAFIPEEKMEQFMEYAKNELIREFHDEEVVNREFINAILKDGINGIKWKVEDAKKAIEKIIEDAAFFVSIETTRKNANELIKHAESFDGSVEDGIGLVKEMERLLNEMENKPYAGLKQEFQNAYGSYLMLTKKIMDKIRESEATAEQKYTELKDLGTYLHWFGNGQYDDIKTELDSLMLQYSGEMFSSIDETNIVKNKAKFWTGMGIGATGLTLLGLGIALPLTVPFGVAIIPVGMKLIKDSMADVKEKYKEFLERNKDRGIGHMTKEGKRDVV